MGFRVVDVGVSLHDGQFHTVDSNELSFKMATALALKEGLPQCQPVLLEPILSVTISAPSDYTSKALQLITQKRGQILGYEGKAGWRGWDEIRAHIPQGEMHDLIVQPALAVTGYGLLRLELRPPAGGAGPAGAGYRRQASRGGALTARRASQARHAAAEDADELRRHARRRAQLQSCPTSANGRSSLKRPAGRSTVRGRCVKSLGTVWMIGPSQSSM